MSSNEQSVPSPENSKHIHLGLAGLTARAFINSPLTALLVIASILLGVFATLIIAREEEPQIKVPMVDVMVSMPGASSKEVEQRVSRPIEKLLWEVPGVEYIYSTSQPGRSLVIVRFVVGQDAEDSLVKLNQKLQSNFDRIPHGVSFPLVKLRSIDDVPILALTLHSATYDHLAIRRVAAELDDAIKQVPQVAETTIIGGERRQIRVLLNTQRLSARDMAISEIVPRLTQANKQFIAGTLTSQGQEISVETGGFLYNVEDVKGVVVGVYNSRPVYLRDIADVIDGASDPTQYVLFGSGAGSEAGGGQPEEAAVTISVAKRPGANATFLADEILRKVDAVKTRIIPQEISISVTRNYGETAAEKSDELLFHMLLAVLGVAGLILLVLGWRESLVVVVAIPATLALTLLVFYLYGYTLNRITLFALIFSIGILVDDAIVVIENIVRCVHLPQNKNRPFVQVAVEAVGEVGNPTILATFAVVAAILPMAFVGGLMGPYMRPIPVGASAAMFFSLLIAFSVTPWAAYHVLQWGGYSKAGNQSHDSEDWFTRAYRAFMSPLLSHSFYRALFLVGIVLLLLGAMSLVYFQFVKVKMLPFDNKSEFQIILNMPESYALEDTARAAREIAQSVRKEPEVRDYQIYVGVSSPYNFNGLVRHYFMRSSPNVADIQVNLVGKSERDAQSHDIVKRLRPRIAKIAKDYGLRAALTEVPPGPPVLQTIVAEIYGPSSDSRAKLSKAVRGILANTPGVVDIDSYIEDDQKVARYVVDREKAAIHGITPEDIANTISLAVGGASVDLLHDANERDDLNVIVELPRQSRTTALDLMSLQLRSGVQPVGRIGVIPGAGTKSLISLRELVKLDYEVKEKSIYHKNLMPVTYVVADVAGEIESPVYAIFKLNKEIEKLKRKDFGGSAGSIDVYNANIPFDDIEPAIKWDGEWHITLEVFRDMGIAFAVVLVLIYVLMVGWFSSYITPLVVMVAIPFSLVGILPAHGAMGAFFTATSMIGFMAGAGIVVRNSIILVDFIEQRLSEGHELAQAVVDAGAIRFRPMMLTAMAVVVGAGVILFDPIFQGLAISLIAGELASLSISRMAVPVLYYMVNAKK